MVLKLKAEALPTIPIENLTKSSFSPIFSNMEESSKSNYMAVARHVVLYIQTSAGMPCQFSLSKKVNQDMHYLVYEYLEEKAGVYAGEEALKIISAIINNTYYAVDETINTLKKIKKRHGLGATSRYIISEIKKRHIPIRHMEAGSLVALGHGCCQKKIRTAVADTTSGIGIEMAGDKEETKNILAQANVPVPKGIIVYSEEELRERINEIRYPLVVKPLNGNHGRGVTTHIYDIDRALFGFRIAKKISEEVIIEEFIPGEDHRFLVIDYKLIAVARRSPATITGNGLQTIQELIDETNKDPQRGNEDEHVLSPIKVDDITNRILNEKRLNLQSVLKNGESLILKDTANISAGGTATDLTDIVHPQNKFMAERIAKLFALDICGVDIMTTRVDIPITRDTGAVIEVNAGPGIRMHSNPQNGKERNVAAPIIDMLFPKKNGFIIPIIVVTGSHTGSVNRLLAEIALACGKKAGFNSDTGIHINGYRLKKENSTDFKSVHDILFDPMIDFAIIACEDKDVFHSGLGFESCDTCIILDAPEINNDIPYCELRLKTIVAETVRKSGLAILNADEDLVHSISSHIACNVALFSIDAENKRIARHQIAGGLVGYIENESFVICKLSVKLMIGSSLGYSPEQKRMILAVVLACYVHDFNTDTVKKIISEFKFNEPAENE